MSKTVAPPTPLTPKDYALIELATQYQRLLSRGSEAKQTLMDVRNGAQKQLDALESIALGHDAVTCLAFSDAVRLYQFNQSAQHLAEVKIRLDHEVIAYRNAVAVFIKMGVLTQADITKMEAEMRAADGVLLPSEQQAQARATADNVAEMIG